MKKMVLILITIMAFGIGCGSSTQTLKYHQWVPVEIHQPAVEQPTQHQHLKK